MADIVPPFTRETALRKVKAAQNLWNTQKPEKVVLAYTVRLQRCSPAPLLGALTETYLYADPVLNVDPCYVPGARYVW